MLAVVTGGAGFIGSHTVDRLIGAGHHVVVLDDFRTGKRANLAQHAGNSRLDIVACDVAHGIFAALAPLTAKHGPVERIVHLAAQVSVVHSVANPLVDMQVNYGGTLHVLEYARASGVKKVTFSSSAAVYGDVDTLPVGEDARCRPVSPYGIDKLASAKSLNEAVQIQSDMVRARGEVFMSRAKASSEYLGKLVADGAKSAQDNFSKVYSKTA